MNDAGRIGFLIKGDYDASTIYNFLDIVFYNGNSYVAKKDGITGITPTEKGENWQLFVTGGEGQKIDVDTELNEASENPVQNKAIYTEITSLKKSVSDGKTLVAEAITGKGVDTATDAEFQTMADNVGKIKTTPNLQSKSASLSTSAQTIKPDSGYDGLSQVTVPAVTGTAVVSDVLASKTFNSAAGISKTGTMVNYSKQTVDVASGGVKADTDNTHSLVNVPKAGYYDTQSKLRVLNSDLANFKEVGIVTSASYDFNGGAHYSNEINVSGYKALAISASITTMRTATSSGTQTLILQGYNGSSWVDIKKVTTTNDDLRWFVSISQLVTNNPYTRVKLYFANTAPLQAQCGLMLAVYGI